MLTTKLDEQGRVVPGEIIFHQGFIANTYGDAPMRAKILYFVGSWLAYLVCAYCRMCGTRKAGTMRYVGYVEPVTASHGKGAGSSLQMGQQHDAGEVGLQQPDSQQLVHEVYTKDVFVVSMSCLDLSRTTKCVCHAHLHDSRYQTVILLLEI